MNELREQVSEILQNTPIGEIVRNDEILSVVLSKHPHYSKCNALSFVVSNDNAYKQKQFKFETKNHKFISFSLSACYKIKSLNTPQSN